MIFNPWAILGAVLFAIALAGGGYYEGWEKRGDHEAAVALEAKQLADVELAKERERGDKLAGELAVEVRNIKTVTVEVIKEIPSVTTVYREAPDAPIQNIVPAVYTLGFVRLWNTSLYNGKLPEAGSKPFDQAGGSDTLRAQIDSPEILTNATENFAKYAECRAQLNKLIDFELGRPDRPQ